jgi:hypothetical protein
VKRLGAQRGSLGDQADGEDRGRARVHRAAS